MLAKFHPKQNGSRKSRHYYCRHCWQSWKYNKNNTAVDCSKSFISNHWFKSNLGRWSWGILSRVFALRISIFLSFDKGLFAETANAANRTIYVRIFGTTSTGNFSNRPTKSKIEKWRITFLTSVPGDCCCNCHSALILADFFFFNSQLFSA